MTRSVPRIALVLVATVACAPIDTQTAELAVSGENVQVNGLPARDGMAVRNGDRISTGDRSWARIAWADGTSLSLDQNADPIVAWDGDVLVVSVGYGWFLIDTGDMRVRIVNELAEVVTEARACVSVRPGERFDLWVFDEVAVDPVRPARLEAAANHRISIEPGGVTTEPITPEQFANIDARFPGGRFSAARPN
jgi:hypothetical protein